jgi:hypothetical protein
MPRGIFNKLSTFDVNVELLPHQGKFLCHVLHTSDSVLKLVQLTPSQMVTGPTCKTSLRLLFTCARAHVAPVVLQAKNLAKMMIMQKDRLASISRALVVAHSIAFFS